MNKKFEVILTDAKTGYDLYPPYRAEAPSFMELALLLESLGYSFRCINDVTKCFEMGEYAFTPGVLSSPIFARAKY